MTNVLIISTVPAFEGVSVEAESMGRFAYRDNRKSARKVLCRHIRLPVYVSSTSADSDFLRSIAVDRNAGHGQETCLEEEVCVPSKTNDDVSMSEPDNDLDSGGLS